MLVDQLWRYADKCPEIIVDVVDLNKIELINGTI